MRERVWGELEGALLSQIGWCICKSKDLTSGIQCSIK